MGKEIVILIGIQASGKTTFCKRYFENYEQISLDVLHTRNKESLAIENCFQSGKSMVIDNTNPTKEERSRYILAAKQHGYKIVGYYFQSNIDVCMQRNLTRSGKSKICEKGIASTHKKLQLPSYSEGFGELWYVSLNGDEFCVEKWKENEDEI